ncbi:3'(2'),5'-bisphosphate nucleotidase CysQ [Avibacterium paragallinarum]|uniref:3'(2'),5'-bisphosphate nucleotidase CysQ n=2 Tax=Avibacterium paragallinarum TaxID=728 RepID=UPI0021F77975|nr:3'(2'),5'-bisphosphate nucleotidase CysQ [Avibacterium paragallinarum]UXN34610.1 3'(2'),5'-bisphosphate nucleotidase CysQ [Avibacterium paragallinarum]
MLLHSSLLQSVLMLAEQAGDHLNHFYSKNLQAELKADNTPVTEADLFVSQFLIEKLTALTPRLPVLSEESCKMPFVERQQWQTYWLVDPLDGTQQFINRTGNFSVLIALVHHNRPVLGVIHSPQSQSTYYAMQGSGAYKKTSHKTTALLPQPLDFTQPIRIAVGSHSAAKKVRSVLNPIFSYDFHIIGSSGIKSALVAEGAADCYVRLGETGEWDTAAAEIILAEMGGGIFDRHFQPLTYNQRETLVNPDFVMVANRQRNWHDVFQFN